MYIDIKPVECHGCGASIIESNHFQREQCRKALTMKKGVNLERRCPRCGKVYFYPMKVQTVTGKLATAELDEMA